MAYFLGIDFGNKYIGLALSDKDGKFSSPYSVVRNNKDFLSFLNDLLLKYPIDTVVIGNPLNSEGEDSVYSEKTKEFSKSIKCKYILWNETLTSFESKSKLSRSKKRIDDVAASIILQEYLDYINKS